MAARCFTTFYYVFKFILLYLKCLHYTNSKLFNLLLHYLYVKLYRYTIEPTSSPICLSFIIYFLPFFFARKTVINKIFTSRFAIRIIQQIRRDEIYIDLHLYLFVYWLYRLIKKIIIILRMLYIITYSKYVINGIHGVKFSFSFYFRQKKHIDNIILIGVIITFSLVHNSMGQKS